MYDARPGRTSAAARDDATDADPFLFFFLFFFASLLSQEAETCIKILTNSTLVVKRIVDKTTNQPRVPVTAELIVKEVRRVAARLLRSFYFLFFSSLARPSVRPSVGDVVASFANDEILSPDSMRLLLN